MFVNIKHIHLNISTKCLRIVYYAYTLQSSIYILYTFAQA